MASPRHDRPPVATRGSSVIELDDVSKVYRTGQIEVEALRGVTRRDRAG